MPTYLFHVLRNGRTLGDASVDLDTLCDMRWEALKALHDIALDEVSSSDLDETLTVIVHDEVGSPVYSATLTICQPLPVGSSPGS
ncbi:hypothetical protein [Mesorhizobium sp. WSM4906]|uniref:DUF6894 family protein n=1 Tax=Mesorhizobium sp. WSM4906 TaxID=3038546 RepID=UPI0024174FF4|nr:hypothetical protein [Mesorhizobium sp. WSM4906]WFP75476.1 hypothetical protein QAZ22_27805 [Mesorhizobium sp. WSM4906]